METMSKNGDYLRPRYESVFIAGTEVAHATVA